MQAPIRFTSAVPGAIAQRQGDQQALQQFFDRNKVEKARMEQIKSLKQLAKGYGASAAQVESSSYGELQGFVQRMELERADKTREEQARLRELQMQQAQQAMMFASEQRDWLRQKRDAGQDLSRFMVGPPPPDSAPTGQFGPDGREIPTLPGDFAQRVVPEQGFKPTGPSINVATGEVTTPTPPIAQPLPERFQALLNSNLPPEAKAQGIAEMKAEAMAQQKLAAEQGNTDLANRIKVNEELRNQTGFTRGERILAFTPERHSLKIDGGSALAISGAIDHEATAVQIKDEALPSFNKGMAAFNRLMEYADQRERENWMSSEDKTAAEALANELRGLLREDILGPGTVQESERAIIAEVLPNPTKYWSFTSGKEGKKRLLELRNSIANKFKERLRGLGLEVEGMTNPANTRQLSTGKEVEIIFDPAE